MSATVDGPIGLFDSGVGGLTVARALADRLPGERLLYFGDTAHLPYGDKSPEAIRGYSLAIARHLVSLGAKAVVVACNSASSVAYDALVEALDVPVFNVIDPVVAEVARLGLERVGIWGTKATIKSGVFPSKLAKANATFRYHYHNIMSSICAAIRDELQHAASTHWRQAQHASVDDLSSRRDPEVES